jgi:gas vesicle protein
MDDDSNAPGLAWFFAGAAVGAAIALLYAPAPGHVTRKRIAKRTDQGRAALQDSGKEMIDRGREMFERGRKMADEAAEMFERGRKMVEETAANLQEKVQG